MNSIELKQVLSEKKYPEGFINDVILFYPLMVKCYGEEKVDKFLREWEYIFINKLGSSGNTYRDKKQISINLFYAEELWNERLITALFHDFCKIGRYEKTYKTVPRKDEKGVEIKDANGKLIWEKQEVISYKQDPGVILGHSAKSVYLIQFFISLTGDEAEAIYSHMGPFDLSEYFTRKDLSAIYSRNKLAYLLHISDMNDLYL